MKVSSKPAIEPKNLQEANAVKTTIKSKDAAATAGASATDATANAKTVSDAGAKVTLSAKAQEIKKVKDAAMKSPDVDQAKVDRIKQALKDGKYDVKADKIADKMVESHAMDEILSA
jgi:negative regulator of flagellin synthesis FlgM